MTNLELTMRSLILLEMLSIELGVVYSKYMCAVKWSTSIYINNFAVHVASHLDCVSLFECMRRENNIKTVSRD